MSNLPDTVSLLEIGSFSRARREERIEYAAANQFILDGKGRNEGTMNQTESIRGKLQESRSHRVRRHSCHSYGTAAKDRSVSY
jgi:hypothetical protein